MIAMYMKNLRNNLNGTKKVGMKRGYFEKKKIIERVSSNDISNCKEFYPPHKFVIQKKAESTKLRVVYDASAKSETGFPLHDYLEKRPFFKINCEMYSKVKLSSGTFTCCQ